MSDTTPKAPIKVPTPDEFAKTNPYSYLAIVMILSLVSFLLVTGWVYAFGYGFLQPYFGVSLDARQSGTIALALYTVRWFMNRKAA